MIPLFSAMNERSKREMLFEFLVQMLPIFIMGVFLIWLQFIQISQLSQGEILNIVDFLLQVVPLIIGMGIVNFVVLIGMEINDWRKKRKEVTLKVSSIQEEGLP